MTKEQMQEVIDKMALDIFKLNVEKFHNEKLLSFFINLTAGLCKTIGLDGSKEKLMDAVEEILQKSNESIMKSDVMQKGSKS